MANNILLCIIQESTRKSTIFTSICKGLRGNAKKPHFFASRGDYLVFLKFKSFISRNWWFLENCFSISRFSFFSFVYVFFSIKTTSSYFVIPFTLLILFNLNSFNTKKKVLFICVLWICHYDIVD